jgi:hypothetical protein
MAECTHHHRSVAAPASSSEFRVSLPGKNTHIRTRVSFHVVSVKQHVKLGVAYSVDRQGSSGRRRARPRGDGALHSSGA